VILFHPDVLQEQKKGVSKVAKKLLLFRYLCRMDVREITAADTWSIRHQVMWPDKPIGYVQLAEDEQGRHFGVYEGDRLVSVISLFMDGQEAQFRKFATHTDEQGKGYGRALLRYLLDKAGDYGVRRLWCNARTSKAAFYERAGFHKTNSTFLKDGIDYVIMERLLDQSH
jgi:GNAT superfamily N-acetyltransferase